MRGGTVSNMTSPPASTRPSGPVATNPPSVTPVGETVSGVSNNEMAVSRRPAARRSGSASVRRPTTDGPPAEVRFRWSPAGPTRRSMSRASSLQAKVARSTDNADTCQKTPPSSFGGATSSDIGVPANRGKLDIPSGTWCTTTAGSTSSTCPSSLAPTTTDHGSSTDASASVRNGLSSKSDAANEKSSTRTRSGSRLSEISPRPTIPKSLSSRPNAQRTPTPGRTPRSNQTHTNRTTAMEATTVAYHGQPRDPSALM